MITRAKLKMQLMMACTGALLIVGSGTGLRMASAHTNPATSAPAAVAAAAAPAAAPSATHSDPPNGQHCDASSTDPAGNHPDCDNDHDTNGQEGHCDNGSQPPDADDNGCPNNPPNGQHCDASSTDPAGNHPDCDNDHDTNGHEGHCDNGSQPPDADDHNCPPPPPPPCGGSGQPSCPCGGAGQPNCPPPPPPPADPCDTHGVQGADKATIADTLYEGGLNKIPVFKNPVPNGPVSGAVDQAAGGGDATSTNNKFGPLAPVVHEVACVVSLVDENISGG